MTDEHAVTTDIDAQWLRDCGYERDVVLGFCKTVGQCTITVGNWPRNSFCVALRFKDSEATVITFATKRDDVRELERLLADCWVDHDAYEDYEE